MKPFLDLGLTIANHNIGQQSINSTEKLKAQDPREDKGTRGVALRVKAVWECKIMCVTVLTVGLPSLFRWAFAWAPSWRVWPCLAAASQKPLCWPSSLVSPPCAGWTSEASTASSCRGRSSLGRNTGSRYLHLLRRV